MQFITNGSHKYVYYPGTGKEQFFDLQADRDEMTHLIYDPSYGDAVSAYRTHLINELQTRPEGFVQNGVLAPVGGPTPSYLPVTSGESDPSLPKKPLEIPRDTVST